MRPPDSADEHLPPVSLIDIALRLTELGYYRGPLDPVDWRSLSRGIGDFQRDVKVRVTGVVDRPTWLRLGPVRVRETLRERYLEAAPVVSEGPLVDLANAPAGPRHGPESVAEQATREVKPGFIPATALRAGASARADPVEVEHVLPELPDLSVSLGMHVYAVADIACDPVAGHWATVYEGELIERAEDAARMTVAKRYGFLFHPQARGIFRGAWQCVPQRRFCYSELGSQDSAEMLRANETIQIPTRRVYPGAAGIVLGAHRILNQTCGR